MASSYFAHPDYTSDVFQRQLFQLAESLHDQVIWSQEDWEGLVDAYFSAEESIWGIVGSLDVYSPSSSSILWPDRAALPVKDSNVTLLTPLRDFEDRVRFIAASLYCVAETFTSHPLHPRAYHQVKNYSDTLHALADRIQRRALGLRRSSND